MSGTINSNTPIWQLILRALFLNQGQCSWYDFAKKFEINNKNIDLKPIPTSSFPTPAQRPKYSVLDKTKIKRTFALKIKNWEDSLKSITI